MTLKKWSLGILACLLLVSSVSVFAAPSDYSAKKVGYWKLQFSSKGNFEQKLSENERKLVVAEIADYWGWLPAEYYIGPRAILYASAPLSEQEKFNQECLVTQLNYGFDVVRYGVTKLNVSSLC